MNKLTQGDFDVETSTEEVTKPKSQAEKRAAFCKANANEISEARHAVCVCSPTRAQSLMVEKADGHFPIDL